MGKLHVLLQLTIAVSVLPAIAKADSFTPGAVSGYVVLYEGTGGHNLQITNVTINGSIGVGGTGAVQFNGPGTIGGALDFSASNSGQYSNNNAGNVGPVSVSYSNTAPYNALTTLNTDAANWGAETGTALAINGNQTVNVCGGTNDGHGDFVFNVTSYSEGNGQMLTLSNTGCAGSHVIFNFAAGLGNVNLGGDVTLPSGLSADQVLWNFNSSGKDIGLNNNASSYSSLDFEGIILAPNDAISIDNSNLIGRVFGGGSSDMQIVSGDTITEPATATPEPSSFSFVLPIFLVGLLASRRARVRCLRAL